MAHWAPFNNDANVEDLVEIIQRDGAAIIDDFLSPEDAVEFRCDIAPVLAATAIPFSRRNICNHSFLSPN